MANSVEMLSGWSKKDYAAETAAQALETQAEVVGLDPAGPDEYDNLGADEAEADSAETEAVAA